MKKSKHTKITVINKMQKRYKYELTEPIGKNFDKAFNPELSPKEMLKLGVFGGRYIRDCKKEYPKDWFAKAKFHPAGEPGHSKQLNYFGVDASQSLSVWQKKGWINKQDPRGWFEWYCRYYMGRRSLDDKRQIKRWKMMKRHIMQVIKNCKPGELECRRKQRQVLLHWAYDSRKI
jgi:hypothetical protein